MYLSKLFLITLLFSIAIVGGMHYTTNILAIPTAEPTAEDEIAFDATKTDSLSTKNNIQLDALTKSNRGGLKFYRNDEFGFEFWYPEGWRVEENTFGSPFSKFNMAVQPPTVRDMFEPFSINIVTPDFVERGFSDMRDMAKPINIDGIQGLEYEFVTDGVVHQTAVIIPLGEYRMILATQEKYQEVFDRISLTIKFIN